MTHSHPASVIDRVRDGGRNTTKSKFANAFSLHRRRHWICLIHEHHLLVGNVGVHGNLVAREIVVDEETLFGVDRQLL